MAMHDMEREHRETWLGFCKLMGATVVGAAVVLILLALFVA
ncbi:MAG: hypothetical protein BroJett029_35330 [Alphaproteobacteria bacterium]|nr:MAG: hypothetical protein BroJett029_35330 [Alphaproteobacteria bacterium]